MKYTIIVPFYNAQETLRRCLDSIQKQSYPFFEVLMIDDGSNDNSTEIASAYTKEDPRFVLIRQPNAGPSKARNRGIDQACGTVISFVDSDDSLEPDYLQQIDDAFEEDGIQIVFFGVRQFETSTGKVFVRNVPDFPQSKIDIIVALTQADLFGYTWIKAISRQLIGQTRFNEALDLFEDEVFTCEIVQKCSAISRIAKPLYNQTISPGSLSRKTHQDYFAKCEAVYIAWRQLMASEQRINHPILLEKANHMAMVYKYYFLEKNISPIMFARGLADCSFLQDTTTDDALIIAIKNKRFVYALVKRVIYRMKMVFKKLAGR